MINDSPDQLFFTIIGLGKSIRLPLKEKAATRFRVAAVLVEVLSRSTRVPRCPTRRCGCE